LTASRGKIWDVDEERVSAGSNETVIIYILDDTLSCWRRTMKKMYGMEIAMGAGVD
jgi:hypothetical protein